MRSQFLTLVGFCSLCCLFQSAATADILFTATQRNAGPIVLGDTALFDIRVATTAPTGTITQFGGVTFYLGVDDTTQLFGFTTGTGGTVVEVTNDTANALSGGRSYLFTPVEGGYFQGSDSWGVFSATGNDRTLDAAGGYLATVQINTTGGTVGFHQITLGTLDATNSLAQELTTLLGVTLSSETLNYEIISPVPEPTSIALLSISGLVFGVSRWKRSKNKA